MGRRYNFSARSLSISSRIPSSSNLALKMCWNKKSRQANLRSAFHSQLTANAPTAIGTAAKSEGKQKNHPE